MKNTANKVLKFIRFAHWDAASRRPLAKRYMRKMILHRPLFYLFIATLVTGCAAPAPVKLTGKTVCTIDSSIYSAPFKLKSGKSVPVPLKDGALVTIITDNKDLKGVLINKKQVFRRCNKSSGFITNPKEAGNVLKYTTISEKSRFVGTELFLCNTVDEGWFFFYSKKIGYIGYAGPSELPLSIVAMKCN